MEYGDHDQKVAESFWELTDSGGELPMIAPDARALLLDLQAVNLPLPDAIRKFARQSIADVVRPFVGKVSRVECVIREVHPSRGSLDRRCDVCLHTLEGGEPISVHGYGNGTPASLRAARSVLSEALHGRWLRVASPRTKQAHGAAA